MPTSNSRPLLIDTHCLVWMQFNHLFEFSKEGLSAIDTASRNGNLLLSIISVWEIGLLVAKSRLKLFQPCEEWIRAALATPGLSLAPLSPEIAIASSSPPGVLHFDPSDRIIVATARHLGATLLTRDRKLIEYAREGHLKVIAT
jgi:PIN domain nuclease of toxin-antitoxin system